MRPRYLDLLFFTGMNDSDAHAVFVALRVPLLALVLWWTGSAAQISVSPRGRDLP